MKMEKETIDVIKTLQNLNEEFPRFQLSTLLKIVECIEEKKRQEYLSWPYYKSPTITTTDFTPGKVTCTYANTENKEETCKCKREKENNFNYKITKQEARYEDGELVEGKTYINDNGDITRSSVGAVFSPSKKNHCDDMTSCNQKVLTQESENENDDEYVKSLIEYLKELSI